MSSSVSTPSPSDWPDAAINALAGRQATMIARRQLLALPVSSSAIDRLLHRRRLVRVHPGVYSPVLPAARPRLAAEYAAWLWAGEDAVLSHLSAAALHGLAEAARGEPVHLTVTGMHRRRSRPGIEVHCRGEPLSATDRVRLAGLPVTSVALTLVDLAAASATKQRELEQLFDRSLSQHKISRGKLTAALAEHRTRPGVARLAGLLHPDRRSADTWSQAEERLLALLRGSGLPAPECNVPVGPYVPDFTWRAQRVVVEFDSRAFHSGERAIRADSARHNELTSAGWQVLHVTWEDLSRHPHRVLVWIAAALARAGG